MRTSHGVNQHSVGNFISKKGNQSRVVGGPEKTDPNDSELFIVALYKWLAIALDKKNHASKSAGKLLALVDALITSNRKKLCDANKEYKLERQRLGKLLRVDKWYPKSPLHQALHIELWHCFFYRGEVKSPLSQPQWNVKNYRPLMGLPKLSLKSLPQWEPKLWQLVKRHNPQLQTELQRRNKRVGDQTRLSKYRKEFQQHLQAIVTTSGILPG